jgi:hypothetical protein
VVLIQITKRLNFCPYKKIHLIPIDIWAKIMQNRTKWPLTQEPISVL